MYQRYQHQQHAKTHPQLHLQTHLVHGLFLRQEFVHARCRPGPGVLTKTPHEFARNRVIGRQ
jgi:hypothetical protein